MRINNKKFIYLISPLKINKDFYKDLIKVLKYKKIGFFQLRLKNENFKKKLLIGKKIKYLIYQEHEILEEGLLIWHKE